MALAPPAPVRWTQRSRRCRPRWRSQTWRCCCCRPWTHRVRARTHTVLLVCRSACPLRAHRLSLWPTLLCSQACEMLVRRMGRFTSTARRRAPHALFLRRHAASEAAGPGRAVHGLLRPAGRSRRRHAGSAAGGGTCRVAGEGLRPGCADGRLPAGGGTNSVISASQRCVVCTFLRGASQCRCCLNTARLLPSAVRDTQLCLSIIRAPVPEVLS
jgi:hypothetical protein